MVGGKERWGEEGPIDDSRRERGADRRPPAGFRRLLSLMAGLKGRKSVGRGGGDRYRRKTPAGPACDTPIHHPVCCALTSSCSQDRG